MEKLVIAILVYNLPDITQNCIKFLKKNTTGDYKIAILNNGSDKKSEKYLKSLESDDILIFHSPTNLGVTKGFNLLYNHIKNDFEYVCIMNNDIYVKEKGWNEKLINELEKNPKLAQIGPIQKYNLNLWQSVPRTSTNTRLDYIEASCMIVSTKIINEKLPTLFDEKYIEWGYCEDSDLSLRLKCLGYEIKEIPIAHEHLHATTVKSIQDPKFRNQIYLYQQHNQNVLKERWEGFIFNKFPVKILLCHDEKDEKITESYITQYLQELKYRYPHSEFYIETNTPDTFKDISLINGINVNMQCNYVLNLGTNVKKINPDWTPDWDKNIVQEYKEVVFKNFNSIKPLPFNCVFQTIKCDGPFPKQLHGVDLLIGTYFQVLKFDILVEILTEGHQSIYHDTFGFEKVPDGAIIKVKFKHPVSINENFFKIRIQKILVYNTNSNIALFIDNTFNGEVIQVLEFERRKKIRGSINMVIY